jgi:hypothetical protein
MQVGVKHPGSLAAFSVVVPGPSRAVGRVPGPADHPAARPGGPVRDSRGHPAGPGPGGQPPAAYAGPRPGFVTWPYAAGRVAAATRGFACYVWDPVTTVGAAGRGSGQAPAGFRGQGADLAFPAVAPIGQAWPGRLSPRPATPAPGRPGASAWPRSGPVHYPACPYTAPRRLSRGAALSPASARPELPEPVTGRAQPASHWV